MEKGEKVEKEEKGGRVEGGKTESDDKRWKPKSDPD